MLAYKALIYFVLITDDYRVHKHTRVFSYDDCSSGTFRNYSRSHVIELYSCSWYQFWFG